MSISSLGNWRTKQCMLKPSVIYLIHFWYLEDITAQHVGTCWSKGPPAPTLDWDLLQCRTGTCSNVGLGPVPMLDWDLLQHWTGTCSNIGSSGVTAVSDLTTCPSPMLEQVLSDG